MTAPRDQAGSQPPPVSPSELPARPSWAPPPGQQPQQSWGANPPGRTDYWGEPGWASQQKPSTHAKRNGCLIGCGAAVVVAILVVVLLVVQAAQVLAPALDVSVKIQQNSHGLVTSTSYTSYNGVGEFRFLIAAGTTSNQARDIACNDVRTALKGTPLEGTRFEILDAGGQVLADETTPCG